MNKRILMLSPLLLVAVLAIGCAESEDPAKIGIEAHPVTWVDPASEDFHGDYVRTVVEGVRAIAEEEADNAEFDLAAINRTGTEGCVSCHGDLGIAQGDQCFACHAVGSDNPTGAEPQILHPSVAVWLAPQDPGFHGRVIADLRGSQECQICHGLEYDGGWTDAECQLCHAYNDLDANGLWNPHPAASEWYDATSNDFHGRQVQLRGTADCKRCHNEVAGQNRWAGVVCAQCHAGGASGHPAAEDWIAGGGHAVASQATATVGADCTRCHGVDLTTGGTAVIACNDCHSWPFEN